MRNEQMATNLLDVAEKHGWTEHSTDEILSRFIFDLGITLSSGEEVTKLGVGAMVFSVATLLKVFEIDEADCILLIDDYKYICTDAIFTEEHRLIEKVSQLINAVNAGFSGDVEKECIEVIRQLKAICKVRDFEFWDCVNMTFKGLKKG